MTIEMNNIWARRRRVSEERMRICESCEHHIKTTNQCGKCGCFLNGKTMFMSSKCPVGKWDKHIEKKDG